MLKIFQLLGAIMVLVATIEFLPDPKKALDEVHRILVSPSPKIVNNHLALPKKKAK